MCEAAGELAIATAPQDTEDDDEEDQPDEEDPEEFAVEEEEASYVFLLLGVFRVALDLQYGECPGILQRQGWYALQQT